MLPLQFLVAPKDSIRKLQLRPWLLILALFQYLLFGTGWFLAPVLELSIFIQSRLLDEKYRVVMQTEKDLDGTLPQNLPDIEIMPVWNRSVISPVLISPDPLRRLLPEMASESKLAVFHSSPLSLGHLPRVPCVSPPRTLTRIPS